MWQWDVRAPTGRTRCIRNDARTVLARAAAPRRQRRSGGSVAFLERGRVDIHGDHGDRGIKFGQPEELRIAQPSEHRAFGPEYSLLDRGLIPWTFKISRILRTDNLAWAASISFRAEKRPRQSLWLSYLTNWTDTP